MIKTPILYKIGKLILSPLFKIYYNPTIIGKENIPKEGAVLIVGNHKHLYDQCLSIIATKRYIRFMAKKEYFDNRKISWFFKKTGCISVDRSKKDNKAVSEALATLEDDGAIGLFPEGTRNKTKEFLLPFKFGTVSMAAKTGSAIIPFGITGEYRLRSKNLIIRFGKPFYIHDMSLENANKKLYNEIKGLMEENLK